MHFKLYVLRIDIIQQNQEQISVVHLMFTDKTKESTKEDKLVNI